MVMGSLGTTRTDVCPGAVGCSRMCVRCRLHCSVIGHEWWICDVNLLAGPSILQWRCVGEMTASDHTSPSSRTPGFHAQTPCVNLSSYDIMVNKLEGCCCRTPDITVEVLRKESSLYLFWSRDCGRSSSPVQNQAGHRLSTPLCVAPIISKID